MARLGSLLRTGLTTSSPATRATGGEGRARAATAVCIALLGAASTFGCGALVKQATKVAAPAAVDGAVDEASDPQTRDQIARVVNDPDIRLASAKFSEALVRGAVRGVQEQVPLEQVERLTQAIVTSMGAALAQSLERDVAPQISRTVAGAVDAALERSLSVETEARIQSMMSALMRTTLNAAGEAVTQVAAEPNPALREAMARVTHDVVYNGALGLEGAVREAQSQTGAGRSQILASLGTVASWLVALPPILVGTGVLLVLGLVVGLLWALSSLHQHRRLLREQTDATRHFTDAMLAAKGADWLTDFASHIAPLARRPANDKP